MSLHICDSNFYRLWIWYDVPEAFTAILKQTFEPFFQIIMSFIYSGKNLFDFPSKLITGGTLGNSEGDRKSIFLFLEYVNVLVNEVVTLTGYETQ